MAQAKVTEMVTVLGATGQGTAVTFVAGRAVMSYARIAGVAGIAGTTARIAHFRFFLYGLILREITARGARMKEWGGNEESELGLNYTLSEGYQWQQRPRIPMIELGQGCTIRNGGSTGH